jgi:hypothetical protein
MAQRSIKEGPDRCQIVGCEEEAARSMSTKKLGEAFDSEMLDKGRRRTKLCKKHYRDYKKATKKDRKLDTLGWE